MTNRELAKILQGELKRRSWTVSDLARTTSMNRETVRRAVFGIGNTSLETANILLAAVHRGLVVDVEVSS
ncbi:MAG: hypothetical protein KF875_03915 [Trueperaceae bacterium]|nr:hypothetical protein [Trueperaceae bacterium]